MPACTSSWAAEFQPRTRLQPVLPECTCRYNGQHLPLGTRRCLQTPDGPRLAVCVKEVNVTSWRVSRDLCPEASLVDPRG
jgi:hypothetical protein